MLIGDMLIDVCGLQFDRERIPERVVHARGAAAKGFFEVRHSFSTSAVHGLCMDVSTVRSVSITVTSALRVYVTLQTREPHLYNLHAVGVA